MQNLLKFFVFVFVCVVFSMVSNGFAEDEDDQIDKSMYVELPSYKAENVLYSAFSAYPRTLDPAVSYSSNEAVIIGSIYEPPLTYHALKRPYELIPLTAEKMPKFVYRWKETGKDLSRDEVKKLLGETTPAYTDEEIAKIDIYLDIKIKKGIYYAPHPCFAKLENGKYKYHNLKDDNVKSFNGDLYNLKVTEKDTRELVAADYVYQMKRMLNPLGPSQIASNLFDYLEGTIDYYRSLRTDIMAIRAERGEMSVDEEWLNPIRLDFDKHEFKAAEVIDKYTYRIHFKKPYVKFLYWMAMPFFSPMPKEAIEFYYQAPLRKENFYLGDNPVGTGPYYLRVFNNERIESWRNPIYRKELYPSEGEASDKAAGFLDDAGKKMPFMDKIIRMRVRDSNQIWEEFLKGRFSLSGLGERNFEKHIKYVNGKPEISQFLKQRGISLNTTTAASIAYIAFNMFDDDWGGLSEDKCKLRQAVAIALDMEEFNQKYTNGRNASCHSPIPPGIYGYENPEDITYIDNIEDLEYYLYIIINSSDKKRSKLSELTDKEKEFLAERYSVFFNKFKELDKEHQNLAKSELSRTPNEDEILAEVRFGMNWAVYKWDKSQNKPVRRSVEYAKKLIKEAGIDTEKEKAEFSFLTSGSAPIYIDINKWREGKLNDIGVKLSIDFQSYTDFQEEARNGNFESLEWGWNADYPDPENFLFLLMGENTKTSTDTKEYGYQGGGENAANYINLEYDKLFNQMKNMKDSPKRLRIIRRMINILRHDCPWILSNLRVSYVLYHSWYKNSKTNLMGNDVHKYRRIDVSLWSKYLEKYAGIKPMIPPKTDDE